MNESEIEEQCRRLICPVCFAMPGQKCHYGFRIDDQPIHVSKAHTGRYHEAVSAGLVPALPGGW